MFESLLEARLIASPIGKSTSILLCQKWKKYKKTCKKTKVPCKNIIMETKKTHGTTKGNYILHWKHTIFV